MFATERALLYVRQRNQNGRSAACDLGEIVKSAPCRNVDEGITGRRGKRRNCARLMMPACRSSRYEEVMSRRRLPGRLYLVRG